MLRHPDYVQSLGSSFHSFVRGQPPDILWRAARVFFSWHLGALKSTRLRPDELGFRGGLAFRMARIFGLVGTCRQIFSPPPIPTGHNVMLSRDDVTMVEEGRLDDELRSLSVREMAAWKFSLEYSECRARSVVRYCLALSRVRQPEVSIPLVRHLAPQSFSRLSDDFSWRLMRKRYFRPLSGDVRMVPVFDRVLLTQDARDWEPPPPYGEESWGCSEACVVRSVPIDKKYGA